MTKDPHFEQSGETQGVVVYYELSELVKCCISNPGFNDLPKGGWVMSDRPLRASHPRRRGTHSAAHAPGTAPPAVGLLGVGIYLPEREMSNEEWSAYVDTSDAWIRERTGIVTRRIAAPEETTVDLAVAAARSALEKCSLDPGDLAEIVVATDTPEVYVPSTACFVQHRLGAPEIPCYDLSGSGCAGFLQALDIARARVLLGRDPVLVIGVELLTRILSWHDRNTAVLFGDGAGAVLVTARSPAAEVLAADSGTDGSQTSSLGIEVGGTRRPFTLEEALGDHQKQAVMHGRQVFREAVKRMAGVSQRVLDLAAVKVEDLALLIPHQANARIVDAVGRSLGVAPEKVLLNVDAYGNMGSASIPVALWEAESSGCITAGDLVLLASFGAGFQWGAMLLRYLR